MIGGLPSRDRLRPYVPGEQPRDGGFVKLNTNESARAPSPRVAAAARALVGEDAAPLRLYPDPTALDLRNVLARRYGLVPDEVFVGNGSDEVLAHAFAAFFAGRRAVLVPDVTYGFYDALASLYDVGLARRPLDAAFAIEPDEYAAVGDGAIFPNPNAPTGRALTMEAVARIATGSRKIVIVDEAYVDFGAESAVPLVRAHPNLLVVQTFSKSRALAGLRVGMAFGDIGLIRRLEAVKDCFNSYPLGCLAQACAAAAAADEAWLAGHVAEVGRQRERLSDMLRRLGFEVTPSLANFLFVRHPRHPSGALLDALRARGVLVRHLRDARIDHLRITVGSAAECDALLDRLSAILGAGTL